MVDTTVASTLKFRHNNKMQMMEKVRMLAIGKTAFAKKIFEYGYKLAGSVVLGSIYALKGKPAQSWPVIKFRVDALKGLLGNASD